MKKAREQTKLYATKTETIKRNESPIEVESKRVCIDDSKQSNTDSDSSEANWSDYHSLFKLLFENPMKFFKSCCGRDSNKEEVEEYVG